MATSQFTIYTSSDPYGPGLMPGTNGSLIQVLDACLVYGYGTGSFSKPAAGWSKPLPNYSSSGVTPSLGCYKQGSGSMCTMFVNDGAPHVTAAYREAWICGFEQILGLTASLYPSGTVFTASAGNGAGIGQFPRPDQQLTYGHVVWRKSNTSDTVGREWIIAADASTMYMWFKAQDVADTYYFGGFGDIFSLAGSDDKYKCMVMGRVVENAGTTLPNGYDWTDFQACGSGAGTGAGNAYGPAWGAQPGHYLQRGIGGGFSMGFTKFAGGCGPLTYANNPNACSLEGVYQPPNGSYILTPIQVIQADVSMYRGRLRGLYVPQHRYWFFANGQRFGGGGDYAGKTFMAIRPNYTGYSVWILEVSSTVETNT